MDDPTYKAPPRAMVVAAKRFLRYHVGYATKPDTIDERVDVALDEWNAWVGLAFNAALAELGLDE